MKHSLLSLSILVVIFSAIMYSCANHNFDKGNKDGEAIVTIEGFIANNTPINNPEMKYSINDLMSFFGASVLVEGKTKFLCLEDINKKFPMEYLRNISGKIYLVYPVEEGGKFVVFFVSELDTLNNKTKLVSDSYFYIKDLPDSSIVANIMIGDTYADIKSLIPNTYLNRLLSSRIESYSIFNNGDVLICTYKFPPGNEYIVTEKTVVSRGDSLYPYEYILESDLKP